MQAHVAILDIQPHRGHDVTINIAQVHRHGVTAQSHDCNNDQ
jgi:hypothetical protein